MVHSNLGDAAGGDTRTLTSTLSDPEHDNMSDLLGLQTDLVRALADNLTPSQREFVNLRYGLLDGRIRSISKCAEIMKLTRSKVSTMDKKCLKTLREAGTRGKLEEYLVLV
jgi:DNA-directed RNA polymerase sigma subunit (sigma70/sigma32)